MRVQVGRILQFINLKFDDNTVTCPFITHIILAKYKLKVFPIKQSDSVLYYIIKGAIPGISEDRGLSFLKYED